MGAATSQSQQLKLFKSPVDKFEKSRKVGTDDYAGLEKQKTQSRILVSINSDNTVRISEGKSIATQTPREAHDEGGENVENKKAQNVTEKRSTKKSETRDRSVQTGDDSNYDREERIEVNPTTIDRTIMIPPLDLSENEPSKVTETAADEKPISHRRVQVAESENEAGETDYWTDIGVQTDDDFDKAYLEPRVAWGSKSVDSAITLHQNLKEANDTEEKEMDTNTNFDPGTPLPVRPFEELVLERFGKYKVRLESDKEKCTISSAAFLETGDAVVIDRSNQKMKFVDKKFQFISSHELPSKPWAVCARGVDVYVTMGNTKIQHLVVENMIIEPVEVFEIKGRCLGICVLGENIAVGLQVGEICLLDFKGVKQGTIQLPKINDKSCNPWHLTVTTECNILVTDSDAGVVYCVNRKSELVFNFKGLGAPRGTAIDAEGNILVVGRDKETGAVVTILHKDVELQNMLHIEQQTEMKNRVLITWADLEFVPYCICYRTDRVAILGGIQESLKIMKIY